MQDFPQFLQERGLTLPDYHKLSTEKQQYLRETWQLEQGGGRAKRYGIEEGRDRDRRRQRAEPAGGSLSWVWLCLVIAAVGAGVWLFVTLVRGARSQIQAGSSPTSSQSRAQ